MPHHQRFVGQEDELRRLGEFYRRALEGELTVGFVAGEPGAGKTALVEEFARRVQAGDERVVIVRGNCNAQAGIGDPYLPFREALTQLTGDVDEEVEQGRMNEENASRLRRLAEVSAEVFVESGPDLVGLLIPGGSLLARFGAKIAPGSWGSKPKAGAERRGNAAAKDRALDQERIFEQVTDVLRELAREQPLVLLLDDLHWADGASIALLFHLGRRLGTAPALVLGTYRPGDVVVGRAGERHPLEPVLNEIKRYEGDVWVDLDGSSEANRRRLFEALVDLAPNRLDAEFREALYRHTRGHPLFTLELLRHMREEGHLAEDDEGRWTARTAPEWGRLPARVEGVIGERIGRLDDDLREALQVASIEGERFRVQIVARVLDRDERALIRRLGGVAEKKYRVVVSKGLRQLAGQRVAEYQFAHNLFQKYLYDSLDEIERAYLHEEVGEILEEVFGERSREIAPDLARHFEAAHVPEKALAYYAQAADNALELFATSEAIRHLRKALAQLEGLPESEERDRKELDLRLRLGACLVGAEGYGAPEVRTAYERAHALCDRLGLDTDAPPILRALAIANIVGANHAEAFRIGEELLRLGMREDNRLVVVEGHYVLGVSAFWLGRLSESREHLEKALAEYDPGLRDVHLSLYAQDPKIICLCRLGWTLWYLGQPEQALEKMAESLSLARELGHPHSRIYADWFAAQLYLEVRDDDRAAEVLDELCQLYEDGGSTWWYERGMISYGWLRGRQGEVDAGLEEMRDHLETSTVIGAVAGFPQDLGRTAVLNLERGSVEKAQEALTTAFHQLDRTQERYHEAELHRIHGELMLARAEREAAAASFQRGLEVARDQQARSLELRAAMSLGRLWHADGRTEKARELVAGVYDRFTEGHATTDLQEARALLEAWS